MNTPSTKVTAGVLAGAVVAIIIGLLNSQTGVDVPPDVAAASVVVVTFVLSYFIKESHPAPSAVAQVNADQTSGQVPHA